eukprot:gb/GEZN01000510.1/.p1 GENE.gb/GEZN01000510.1/~~gb/GEZN01000510.1/.p1  ORF type:complete len:1304 (-),score=191.80 gb/GEZN01000510.1/:351-4007(-)
MTLVLGAPGSGKTSFLKALAGRLPKDRLKGNMKINNQDVKDLRVENIFDYIGQTDDHLPLLSVRETLAFAERCQSSELTSNPDLGDIRRLRTDIVMKFLGIDRVADTIVGNAMIRGVSGGQRKRVTIGEMLIGPKPVYLMDEISTGLDAATALEIVTGLKVASEVFETTFVIALLQPSPEIFNLFDDVLLLAEGQISYHGPIKDVMEYFDKLGFSAPFFKDKADYLQEICTPDGQRYAKQGSDHPRNAGEFVTRWKKSALYAKERQALQAPWNKKVIMDPAVVSKLNQEFSSGFWDNTKGVIERQWKLTVRDKEYTRRKFLQVLVIGLLLGSLNFQIPKASQQDALLVYSVFFFVATFMALGGLPVVNSLLLDRPVFYKQRSANFLRTSSYVLSMFICSIPLDFFVTLSMSMIIYWMCGFRPAFTNFFVFFTTMFMLSVSLSSLFRFLSSAMPDLTTAQPVMGGSIILQTLFAGYIITSNKIFFAWKWAYWFTPMSWGFRALALNEFLSDDYDEATGIQYLEFMGVATEKKWIIYSYIYMVSFTVFFYLAQVVVLTYCRFEGSHSASTTEGNERDEEDGDFSSSTTKLNINNAKEALKALHFNPTVLSFHSLNYFVDHPREKGAKLQLLRGVNGWAEPGRMIALMGETGAGKTTLMDVIAGRKTGGIIEGKILFNGFELAKKNAARVLGYVEQMDIHSPTQTVREALMFSANLRLPRQVHQKVREQFVEQVLRLLELDVCADDIIGEPGDGLSMEQRKRVTCGVELVANPDVLFLDEPTSGLDSRAAQVVMRVIRNITATGRTVICTIHQPSQEIFFLFDDLLLLQSGGLVAYFNPLGKDCEMLIDYFQSFPDTDPIQRGINPADWMLGVLKKQERLRERGNSDDFATRYVQSEMHKKNMVKLKSLELPAPEAKQIHPAEVLLAPTRIQIKVVFTKAFLHYWRTPSYSFTRVLFFVVVACLYGTVFFQLQWADLPGIQSRVGLIYSTTIFSGVAALQSVIPVLSDERVVYYRERASRTYDVVPYSWALTITELPYLLISSFLFSVILYKLVGLRPGIDGFLFYWLVYFLYTVLQVFFGQLLAVAMPTAKIAAAMGAGLIMLWNLFCGFLIPRDKIPQFWIWMYWLSPTRYAIEALEVDQFYCDYHDLSRACPPVTITSFMGDNGQPIQLQVPAWAYVEQQYNFDPDLKWTDVYTLVGMIFACNISKLLCLKYVSHLKR